MNKSSRLFRKLNCLTACHCSLNRHALRISRALCEANDALPSRRRCCNDRCCRGDCNDRCCRRDCRKRPPFRH